MKPNSYAFRALKRGETSRTCVLCGKEYEPASRNQKRCPTCKNVKVKR